MYMQDKLAITGQWQDREGRGMMRDPTLNKGELKTRWFSQ